jgi:hypothetical protein
MNITHSMRMPVPAQRLWNMTVDVESWPTITPNTITSVQQLDPGALRVGSRVRIKQPGQPWRVWTVDVFVEPATFAWSTRSAGMTMAATHRIEPDDSDSAAINHLELRLTGPVGRLLGRLASGRLRRTLATENESFRAALAAQSIG